MKTRHVHHTKVKSLGKTIRVTRKRAIGSLSLTLSMEQFSIYARNVSPAWTYATFSSAPNPNVYAPQVIDEVCYGLYADESNNQYPDSGITQYVTAVYSNISYTGSMQSILQAFSGVSLYAKVAQLASQYAGRTYQNRTMDKTTYFDLQGGAAGAYFVCQLTSSVHNIVVDVR